MAHLPAQPCAGHSGDGLFCGPDSYELLRPPGVSPADAEVLGCAEIGKRRCDGHHIFFDFAPRVATYVNRFTYGNATANLNDFT